MHVRGGGDPVRAGVHNHASHSDACFRQAPPLLSCAVLTAPITCAESQASAVASCWPRLIQTSDHPLERIRPLFCILSHMLLQAVASQMSRSQLLSARLVSKHWQKVLGNLVRDVASYAMRALVRAYVFGGNAHIENESSMALMLACLLMCGLSSCGRVCGCVRRSIHGTTHAF